MSKSETGKEYIIKVTTKLIERYNGDTKKITARMIANEANIGLGLINYHFGSKENLIKECVQKIIKKVLVNFTPNIEDCDGSDDFSDKERLISWACQIYDFLFKNQSVIRISILSDMDNYTTNCNSVYTQRGLIYAVRNSKIENTKKLIAFILVSSMQVAFLAKESAKDILGYDLYSKTERDLFVRNTVNLLFDGIEDTKGKDNEV